MNTSFQCRPFFYNARWSAAIPLGIFWYTSIYWYTSGIPVNIPQTTTQKRRETPWIQCHQCTLADTKFYGLSVLSHPDVTALSTTCLHSQKKRNPAATFTFSRSRFGKRVVIGKYSCYEKKNGRKRLLQLSFKLYLRIFMQAWLNAQFITFVWRSCGRM